MSTGKRYLRLFSKVLLVTGYIFLFAAKFNHRFFVIANFFDYQQADKLASHHGACSSWTSSEENKSHLGVDKRYSIKDFVKLPFTDFSVSPSYQIVARIFFVPLKVYASSHLSTTALRGPPCA